MCEMHWMSMLAGQLRVSYSYLYPSNYPILHIIASHHIIFSFFHHFILLFYLKEYIISWNESDLHVHSNIIHMNNNNNGYDMCHTLYHTIRCVGATAPASSLGSWTAIQRVQKLPRCVSFTLTLNVALPSLLLLIGFPLHVCLMLLPHSSQLSHYVSHPILPYLIYLTVSYLFDRI